MAYFNTIRATKSPIGPFGFYDWRSIYELIFKFGKTPEDAYRQFVAYNNFRGPGILVGR